MVINFCENETYLKLNFSCKMSEVDLIEKYKNLYSKFLEILDKYNSKDYTFETDMNFWIAYNPNKVSNIDEVDKKLIELLYEYKDGKYIRNEFWQNLVSSYNMIIDTFESIGSICVDKGDVNWKTIDDIVFGNNWRHNIKIYEKKSYSHLSEPDTIVIEFHK